MEKRLGVPYKFKVREHNLDSFGHMNNAVYLQYFEDARWEIATAAGCSLEEVQKTGLGPVVLGIEIQFKKEIKAQQAMTVVTALAEYRGKIWILEQSMQNERGDLCCAAKYTMGFFDTKARRLTLPSGNWLRMLGLPEAAPN